jgi:hypothetical protein
MRCSSTLSFDMVRKHFTMASRVHDAGLQASTLLDDPGDAPLKGVLIAEDREGLPRLWFRSARNCRRM